MRLLQKARFLVKKSQRVCVYKLLGIPNGGPHTTDTVSVLVQSNATRHPMPIRSPLANSCDTSQQPIKWYCIAEHIRQTHPLTPATPQPRALQEIKKAYKKAALKYVCQSRGPITGFAPTHASNAHAHAAHTHTHTHTHTHGCTPAQNPATRPSGRRFHPDRQKTDAEKPIAEKRFKEIGEANELLMDTTTRRLWDEGYDQEEIKQRVEMMKQQGYR